MLQILGWTYIKQLNTQRDHHCYLKIYMLVVSTHLKNISQIGSFPQVGKKNEKKCENNT